MRYEQQLGARRNSARSTGAGSALALLSVGLLTSGCAMHAQHREQAERHWNQVRTDVKHQLAVQQFERGQIETAIATIEEAIAVDGTSAEQFLLLAHCYQEQGKLTSARRALTRAQRCDPHAPEVEYAFGLLAERADQLEEALTHYRRARLLDGDVVDYLVAEAECLTAAGDPEAALELLSDHLGRFDSDGTLEALIAQICLLIGDRERALSHLRLAFERSGCGTVLGDEPGGCDILIEECGKLLSETGRHTGAVALLGPYVEARPDAPSSVVAALCAGHLANHRVEQARHLLRRQVRRQPDDARCWMLLARLSVETGDLMTARRCANRLEQLVPDSAPVHLLRGFVCWKQEDLPAAEVSLRKTLSIDPGDVLTHCVMGQVLDGAGQHAAAQEHYRRALQIDPQSAWALQLLDTAARAPISHGAEVAAGVPAGRGGLP